MTLRSADFESAASTIPPRPHSNEAPVLWPARAFASRPSRTGQVHPPDPLSAQSDSLVWEAEITLPDGSKKIVSTRETELVAAQFAAVERKTKGLFNNNRYSSRC